MRAPRVLALAVLATLATGCIFGSVRPPRVLVPLDAERRDALRDLTVRVTIDESSGPIDTVRLLEAADVFGAVTAAEDLEADLLVEARVYRSYTCGLFLLGVMFTLGLVPGRTDETLEVSFAFSAPGSAETVRLDEAFAARTHVGLSALFLRMSPRWRAIRRDPDDPFGLHRALRAALLERAEELRALRETS